jgi:hypothetical protein
LLLLFLQCQYNGKENVATNGSQGSTIDAVIDSLGMNNDAILSVVNSSNNQRNDKQNCSPRKQNRPKSRVADNKNKTSDRTNKKILKAKRSQNDLMLSSPL